MPYSQQTTNNYGGTTTWNPESVSRANAMEALQGREFRPQSRMRFNTQAELEAARQKRYNDLMSGGYGNAPGGHEKATRQTSDEFLDAIVGGGSGGNLTANIDSAAQSAYDQANAQMQQFLGSQAPQFQAAQYEGPGPNRFETGLASSEKRMNALLDDPSSIQQTAAYKFRLGQGQEALQRQQAARGMLGSGNRLMELTKYGQDMASQEYDAQAQRLQNLLGSYQGAWNQAQGTNVQEALGKYGTAMQGALGSYSTAMQGHTARGNTLADLLGQQVNARTAMRGQDVTLQGQNINADLEREKMDNAQALSTMRLVFGG